MSRYDGLYNNILSVCRQEYWSEQQRAVSAMSKDFVKITYFDCLMAAES